jgi:puromycin-sensitive aminopeptidase
MSEPSAHRLPSAVQPTAYRIELEPDLEAFTFAGTEEVDLTLASPTGTIVCNAVELSVSEAALRLPDGSEMRPSAIATNEDTERLTLTFAHPVPAGTATLRLGFAGTLNDQMRGFYRSRYEGADGVMRHMASTQFEATDARRAFPCWDEPSTKATFEVSLVVPQDLTAVSNMPERAVEPLDGGRKRVRFAPSPRMSTYLVAMVVGDLACVQDTAADGTLVRVFATKGKEEQGRFALEHSIRIFAYMNDYFGIPYPLPKMDHLAIPDFAAGAMENWGAITYREVALLFDPANSAAQARQRILEVVAHEMAHMWFGDLVTMEWWDDLWLNESFASWMGDKAVDHLYPEWQKWTQFVSDDTNAALALDGLRNSHPIEVAVDDPNEIRELFDAISYSKGGSVLRMLEDYLTPEVFQKGLGRYLAAHQYGNARTEHLWTALAEASGKPVTVVMDSWVKQVGYPVVDASIRRSEAGAVLSLTQQRFLYDHLLEAGAPDATVWQVPVGVVQEGLEERDALLMTEGTASTALTPAPTPEGWVKVNAGQTGFFRVRYEDAEWARLEAAVRTRALPATDRLGLQDDAYALMKAGYLPATVFLGLARAYAGETEAPVWSDLAANLKGLEGLLLDQECLAAYRAYAQGIFTAAAAAAGWEAAPGEGHLDALRRSTVLGQAGGYGDAAVRAEALARFRRFVDDHASLRPDLRAVTFGLAAAQGGREVYDALWALYHEAPLHEEKMRALAALTRSDEPALLDELLERSMGEEVRSQDTPAVLVLTAGNPRGRDRTWRFVQEHWEEIDRRYGKGGFAITRVVGITGGFTSMEHHAQVEAFFAANPAPSAARTIQQSLERIRLNARWLERNAGPVGEWLTRG